MLSTTEEFLKVLSVPIIESAVFLIWLAIITMNTFPYNVVYSTAWITGFSVICLYIINQRLKNGPAGKEFDDHWYAPESKRESADAEKRANKRI